MKKEMIVPFWTKKKKYDCPECDSKKQIKHPDYYCKKCNTEFKLKVNIR